MGEGAQSPAERVRPLVRVRQMREFTAEPPSGAQLDAIVDAARWSGSSRNSQPWRLIVIREPSTLRRIAEAGMPQTRSLQSAPAAVAIAMPAEPEMAVSHAFDEARVAERILVAANLVGLGAGISWASSATRPAIGQILGLPDDRTVRTIVAIGHPTDEARKPKSAPGQGRLPRSEVIFSERWPAGTK
jgi:nitroreductase